MRLRSSQTDAVLALCLSGFLLTASGGLLQTTTAHQAAPATPEPVICAVAPRSAAEILALAESVPGEGEPMRALPAGEPADAATTAAIADVLAEMAACLTAGHMHRFYALHSDDWLRRFTAGIAGLTTFTTSTAPLADGDRAVYLGPWHVQVLSDGRVMAAALLRIGDELHPDPNRVRVLVFIHRDGRWLVDETIEKVQISGCEAHVDVVAVVGPPPGSGLFDSWPEPCA